jgi:hypothetical protein
MWGKVPRRYGVPTERLQHSCKWKRSLIKDSETEGSQQKWLSRNTVLCVSVTQTSFHFAQVHEVLSLYVLPIFGAGIWILLLNSLFRKLISGFEVVDPFVFLRNEVLQSAYYVELRAEAKIKNKGN